MERGLQIVFKIQWLLCSLTIQPVNIHYQLLSVCYVSNLQMDSQMHNTWFHPLNNHMSRSHYAHFTLINTPKISPLWSQRAPSFSNWLPCCTTAREFQCFIPGHLYKQGLNRKQWVKKRSFKIFPLFPTSISQPANWSLKRIDKGKAKHSNSSERLSRSYQVL